LTLVCMVCSLIAIATIVAGCLDGSADAEAKVDEALGLIEGSQPLLEDLLKLDNRFNTLGERFTSVEDTIAEGKSLAEMALLDIDELEARYTEARDLLNEVVAMQEAGDYGEYARLILAAVEKELEALAVNRQLLTSVWDMLDVLPMAERQEQLSYFVEEIDTLTAEVSTLMEEAASAAAEADQFREEHGL
jgi:peptidoglycan hydrolase CwlO-like protein